MKPAKAVLLICSLFYFSVISAQTITASNGLTKSSNDIQLRGTLNQATAIDLGSTFTFKFSKGVSNYFFLDNSGNIGIGTGSPTAQWHTTGSVRFQGLTTNNTLTNILVADANGNLSLRDASTLGGGGSGITSLNDLTGATQIFAVGTTGSDFTISSSGSTHTFNIPDASLTARGFVSTGTQTFEGQKTFNASTSFNGSVNTVTLNLAGSGVINFSNGIIGIATPQAGHGILFTKTDKKLYYKDDSGTEYDLTASGGSGMTNPMTTLGDIIYGGSSGTATRLAGNTTTAKKFLTQTGDGTNSAAPGWNTISANDVPDLSATYIKNQTSQQSSANFNIDGTGTANKFTTQVRFDNGAWFEGYANNSGLNALYLENIGLAPSSAVGVRFANNNGIVTQLFAGGSNNAFNPDGFVIDNLRGHLLINQRAASKDIIFTTNFLSGIKAQLFNNGNFAIGANPIDNGNKFQVYGNIYASGSVGLGQTSPTAYLHIGAGTASGNTAPLKFTAGTLLAATEAGAVEYDGSHLYFTATNGGTRYQLDQQAGGGTNYWTQSGTDIYNNTPGNVGIGTSSPQAPLDIAGGSGVRFLLYGTGGTPQYLAGLGIDLGQGTHSQGIFIGNNSDFTVDQATAFENYPYPSGYTTRFIVKAGGNVGIGTVNPGPYKLAVEGTIGARRIKVTQVNPWADYVFEDEYKLLSLSEVEKFIHKYKHLPEVPSAKEVEKNGLDLGDSQTVLLKKIEELTLYIIDINKKVEKLSEENAGLKKKLERKNK